jgi:hypothetical protein
MISTHRTKEVHHIMQTTQCHGETHVFSAEAEPGTTCACGKTVWIKPAVSASKSEGPTAVNEPLEKSHKWPDR